MDKGRKLRLSRSRSKGHIEEVRRSISPTGVTHSGGNQIQNIDFGRINNRYVSPKIQGQRANQNRPKHKPTYAERRVRNSTPTKITPAGLSGMFKSDSHHSMDKEKLVVVPKSRAQKSKSRDVKSLKFYNGVNRSKSRDKNPKRNELMNQKARKRGLNLMKNQNKLMFHHAETPNRIVNPKPKIYRKEQRRSPATLKRRVGEGGSLNTKGLELRSRARSKSPNTVDLSQIALNRRYGK